MMMIREFLASHVKNAPADITPETTFESIGVDSMTMLEMMFEIEDKYAIHIPENVAPPANIGQLLELMRQYKPVAAHE
jgi:acyl carrier protein